MSRSVAEIQDWLVTRISTVTGVPADEINVGEPVRRYGLDSVAVVTMIADLETWLGVRLRENPLDEHPTVAALAQYLAQLASK